MTGALPLRRRFALLRARVGASLLDAAIPAYAAWCVGYLATPPEGVHVLSRFPLLLLAAPVLGLLAQASGRSLGQRAHDLRLLGPDGAPADRDLRALASLLGLARLAVLVLPFPLLGAAPAAALVLPVVLLEGVAVLVDPAGRTVLDQVLGTRPVLEPSAPAVVRSWTRRANGWLVAALLLLTFAVGFQVTDVSLGRLAEGAGRTRSLWRGLLTPDWSIAGEVIALLVETVFLALMASALALPFAFALGFLGAANLMGGTVAGQAVYLVVRVLMTIVRSIEPLFWGIVFTIWVSVGAFAGMLALLVHSAASLGKLYSEAIESADPGPLEAIRSTGANALQVARYGVLPQVFPAFLSFTIYRWDINVRMATILGLIGGGGIGAMILTVMQFGAWSKFATIVFFVTLLVLLLDLVSARARRRVV